MDVKKKQVAQRLVEHLEGLGWSVFPDFQAKCPRCQLVLEQDIETQPFCPCCGHSPLEEVDDPKEETYQSLWEGICYALGMDP